jgi:hypothetical protein
MLKKIKLDDLIPYPKNPRKNDDAVKWVLKSLQDHGQVAPIIVNEIGHPFEQYVINAGHTRWKALKEFGAKEADCIVHKFKDEEEFAKYNIQDNQTSTFSEWDEAMLAQLGAEFEIDLSEMGFSIPDEEDFSDKNQEIDMDNLDDACELKIKMDAETYENVLGALHLLDDDILKALLKALNVS